MDTPFSEWLLEQMRLQGVSQSEFARLSGLTRQAINYYITGKSKQPDEFALQKIAAALDLPPEDVYRAAGIPLSHPKENPIIRQIVHLINDLPQHEQQDILEFVRLRRRISEQRGKYETGRTHQKPAVTR